MRSYLLLLLGVFVFTACKPKSDENAGLNQAPLAVLNVKEITLADTGNLVSTVRVFWTGSDADGFVKGFRLSLNNQPFTPLLLRTDSLFRFTLTPGNLTERISVRIIAVDNLNAESAPAELILPIRNTPPSAVFNPGFVPRADTILGVLSLPFIASDADGDNTLDSIYIRVNNGPWLSLASTTSTIYLMADNPRQVGVQTAKVFTAPKLNAGGTLNARKLQNLQVGGFNVFEIKATDKAGAESAIGRITQANGTDKPFFIRPITSDLLVLDAHTGSAAPTPESIYNPTLAAAYPQGYDKIDLYFQGGRNQQRQFIPVMTMLLAQYRKVFWYSDDARLISGGPGVTISSNRADSTQLLMETIAPVFADYISRTGNHLLFSAVFPDGSGKLPTTSTIYGLLPVDSILWASNRSRLANRNRLVVSSDTALYPNLRTLTLSQGFSQIAGVESFYPNAQCDTLYTAPISFTSSNQPTGSRAVGGRYPKGSTKPSLVFFTMDLHQLAGSADPTLPEFRDFFQKVLNRDFN